MSYVPLEKVLDKTDYSVYRLVILAAKRALEIAEGQPKLVEVDSATKPTTIALMELAEGKIVAKKVKSKE
jgi:DNA-directed RNA polymerase omega subunit